MSTLERLKELDAKAAPAPWNWSIAYGTGFINGPEDINFDYQGLASAVDYVRWENAQLIAEMRNALPKLLAVVEAVQDTLCIETPKQVLDALAALDEQGSPK